MYHGRIIGPSRNPWRSSDEYGTENGTYFSSAPEASRPAIFGLAPPQSNWFVATAIFTWDCILKLTSTEVASAFILGLVSLHTFYPPFRPFTRKFLHLSYSRQADDIYWQGPDDTYFVVAWVVNFTALRAICIEWILIPTAEYFGVTQKNRLRLAEQAWLAMYYGTFWGLGMVRDRSEATYSWYGH